MPVVVPIRILQGLLYVVGAYFLCASSVLFIRKIVSVPPEVSRKLLHLSAIIVLTVWLYAFADWRITEVTISGVRRRGAPDPSPSPLDKGSVYKRSAHRFLSFKYII